MKQTSVHSRPWMVGNSGFSLVRKIIDKINIIAAILYEFFPLEKLNRNFCHISSLEIIKFQRLF